MRVARLTIVYAKDVGPKAAKHLTDEIASDAIGYDAVDAVKCEVVEFDKPEIDAFWDEALETSHPREAPRTAPEIEDARS